MNYLLVSIGFLIGRLVLHSFKVSKKEVKNFVIKSVLLFIVLLTILVYTKLFTDTLTNIIAVATAVIGFASANTFMKHIYKAVYRIKVLTVFLIILISTNKIPIMGKDVALLILFLVIPASIVIWQNNYAISGMALTLISTYTNRLRSWN